MNLLDEDYLDAFGADAGREGAKRFFDTTADFFDLFGFDDAAKKLLYYRSGRGSPFVVDDNEMARHPDYGEAVDKNRTKFESGTFTGQSESGAMMGKLLAIPDGGSTRIKDFWEKNVTPSSPSTHLNFGRFALKSAGDFDVTRNGNKFTWSGVIDHRLGADATINNVTKFIPERFDFNDGQPGKSQANIAERYGDAAPFDLVHPNRQRVDAQVTYDPTPTEGFPNGRFIIDRVDWRPLGVGPDGKGWWERDWDPLTANGELAIDP